MGLINFRWRVPFSFEAEALEARDHTEGSSMKGAFGGKGVIPMEQANDHVLLHKCVRQIGSQLDDWDDRAMRRWWKAQASRTAGLTASLLAVPDSEWPVIIGQHRAHCHPWYDQLAQEASLQGFAEFLLENRAFPPLLPLMERTLQVQVCNESRAALVRHIAEARQPVPQAELMERLLRALRRRAGECVSLESFTSMIHQTLVLYYGYYCDPWNLVGALYATEALAYHRMAQMDAGLVRLGFDAKELEFVRVHLTRGEERAKDWGESVISPSVRICPALRVFIAEGIAACLETSARYLDDLCIRQIQRAQRGCIALGAQMSWTENSR